MRSSTTIIATIVAALISSANGHHGVSSEMDLTEFSQVRGIIKDIEWINPHVVVYVAVDQGTVFEKEWIIHMDSPSDLLTRGLSRDFFMDLSDIEFTVYHYKSFRCEEKCMGWGSEALDSTGVMHVLTKDLYEAVNELSL